MNTAPGARGARVRALPGRGDPVVTSLAHTGYIWRDITLYTTTRTEMANADKVRDIIEKELGVEREKLTDNASFIDDLGADSLDIVELVMEFEKEFNIDIPDEDAEKLRTVGEAIAYLDGKVQG